MRPLNVVALVERVDGDLPVRREHRRQVGTKSQTVQVVGREQRRHRLEVVGQRRCGSIQTDPDEATPSLDPHRSEARVGRHRIELVLIDNLDQFSL